MKITGFGDYLIHFSPIGNERFLQAETMHMSFTGAEANVCAALALWGEDVSFVTRLPHHPLAEKSVMFMRSFGANTKHIRYGGKRMGLYFLENGASVRPSKVIYDRMDSAFTEAVPSDFDIDAILTDTDILFLTGITPALSENLFDCTLALCKEASLRHKVVIYDVNFRPTLGSAADAEKNLRALAPYITTLIGNEEHLKTLLHVNTSYGEDHRRERLSDIVEKTREQLHIPEIAVTVRRTLSASDAVTYAAFSNGKEPLALSEEYHLHVVDRVGSGDAFSAGLVYAKCHDYVAKDSVRFAAASGAIKHTIHNDINFATVEEIKHLLESNSTDVTR